MLLHVNLLAIVNIGKRLKELRTKLGLSQLELCQRSGISQASIARIEANKQKNLKSETIQKLSEALDIPLFGFLEKPQYIKEETQPYGAIRMLPVISLQDLLSNKIPSLLKEIAITFEPVLTHAENAFFLKGTVPIICSPYINEGDLLLVEPHAQIQDSDLVLLLSYNEVFIGKIFFDLPLYILQPLNQSQKPFVFTRKKRDVKIMRIGEMRKKF